MRRPSESSAGLAGAVCGKASRTALCGGRSVMSAPTAIIIFLDEAHLRRILKSYTRYYNETRTHLALDKDPPLSRTVMRAGRILCRPVLGGLHHEYGASGKA
jgi:hypothetical protein